MATTWNASAKSTRVTLSGGSLIATSDGVAANQVVEATVFKSTGKWYAEFSVAWAGGSTNIEIGITQASQTFGDAAALSATTANGGYGYGLNNNNDSSASIRFNNSETQGGLTAATWNAHKIGVAYDADGATVQWYRDGTAVGTAQAIAGGSWCFAANVNNGSSAVSITANFGATSFSNLPSGFLGIDQVVSITPPAGSLALAGQVSSLVASVQITPTAGSLSLTGQTGSISIAENTGVTPARGSLTLTGHTGIAKETTPVTPDTGVLTLTVQSPTTILSIRSSTGVLTLAGQLPITGLSIVSSTGSLALSGVAPTLTYSLTLTPDAGAFTFTGLAPVLSYGLPITPATGILTFTGVASDVINRSFERPSSGSLSITGYAPALSYNAEIDPASDSVTLTGVASSVVQSELITPTEGNLSLTGNAPDVIARNFERPPSGALVITGNAPGLSYASGITPNTGVLSTVGYAPAFAESLSLQPTTGSLSLIGEIASLIERQFERPLRGALVITGYAPQAGRSYWIVPSTADLTVSGYAPDLSYISEITPTEGSISLTGVEPELSYGLTITPDTGSLTLVGEGPPLIHRYFKRPPSGSLSITGYAPELSYIAEITPGTGVLTLTGFAPGLPSASEITPGTGVLTLTGEVATVRVRGFERPLTASLAITGYAPDVIARNFERPISGSLVITGYAPTVDGPREAYPTTGSLTVSGHAPIVDGEKEAYPATGALTLSGYAPTVDTSRSIQTVTGSLTFTRYAPTISVLAPNTWDPAAKNANIGLTNGNLTATQISGGTALFPVHSTTFKSSGKWYFELSAGTGYPFAQVMIGISTAAGSLANGFWPGQDATGYSWESSDPGLRKWHAGSAVYGDIWTNGDIISVLFDADAGTLEFWRNGVSKGVAFTGITAGSYCIAAGIFAGGITGNWGASAFTYSMPVGYSSWAETDTALTPGTGSMSLSSAAPAALTSVFAETTLLWDIEASVTGLLTLKWRVTPTIDVLSDDPLMPYLLKKKNAIWLDVNTLHSMNGQPTLLPNILAINNSLRNLLRCPLGERGRIRRPDYGTYLWHMLQEPMDQTSANQIRATLIQSIEQWEPRIKINYPDTYVRPDLMAAVYYVRISYVYVLTNTSETITFSVAKN